MKKILLGAFAILKYDCKFNPNLIFKTHWIFVRNTLSIFFTVSTATLKELFSKADFYVSFIFWTFYQFPVACMRFENDILPCALASRKDRASDEPAINAKTNSSFPWP
jgi:hypothetical protein